MDRDISKIWIVLNSAYHEEQAVEVSRKSVNFSFFVVKGLKNIFSFSVLGNLHFGWLQCLLRAVLWQPYQHQWCQPGTGSKCCLGPGPEDSAATRLWSFLWQPVHQLPPPRQALGDRHFSTGTVWQNQLPKVPIVTKKEVLKKTVEWGFQETIYKGDQILVCWKDNQPVYVATNKFSAERSATVGRFCRTQRKKIQVRFE